MSAVKFPKARVRLVGKDGNASFILARVIEALKKAGATEAERAEFLKQATAGDYGHLLRTCMEWANCS
jgi:hypothetical protein